VTPSGVIALQRVRRRADESGVMWLDVIALLVLGIFAGMGMLRGGLVTAMGLLSLAVAYAAAIATASRFGPEVARGIGLPEFLGLPLAGMAGFMVAFAAMGLLTGFLRRRSDRRRRGQSRSARDRFAGAIFGAARGALIVLLLSWLAIWVDALRVTGTLDGLPEIGDSAAAAVTESVVETGVQAALSDAGAAGPLMARVAARPSAAVTDVQAVLAHPRIEDLREDRLFWAYVEGGSVESALNQNSFARIVQDEELRRRFANLGLIEESAADDPRAFREVFAEVLRAVGPRLRGLRDDPELARLMEDPEVVAMVDAGNTWALISHSGFQQLVARVASNGD
jgi:membrane protein required for colicin V production